MRVSARLLTEAGAHWFMLLLPVLLLVEYGFARTTDWPRDGVAESALIFDLCLFVPALHLLCYRRRVAAKPLLIRTGGLSLLGLAIASWLVPPQHQLVLSHLAWLRPFGLTALALLEAGLLIGLIGLAFSGRTTAADLAGRSGAPLWVARLMLLEARFWKAVWRLLRRHP